MERQQLVQAAVAKANAMGWDAIAEDSGSVVEMLLAAVGASDQRVLAPLSRLGAELAAVGQPKDHPVLEEYDLEADVIPEPALVEQDGSWTEEAERLASPGDLPAGPDGEDTPDIVGPHEEEAKKEKEMCGMKDVYRSLIGQVSDQDRGGIPCPQDKEKEMAETKVAVRSSSVFRVQGLKNGKPFVSGIYRSIPKVQNGARGAVAAGLSEVRIVRLNA